MREFYDDLSNRKYYTNSQRTTLNGKSWKKAIGDALYLQFAKLPKNKKHPPGPTPFLIIENLLKHGDKPHKSLADLAKLHGPVI
ncbi:hypothetical protein LguiA_017471 [Lonicera macranthoides]